MVLRSGNWNLKKKSRQEQKVRNTIKKGKRKKNEPEIKRKKMTLVSDKGPAAGQGKTFDVRLFSAAT